jgi:CRP-like cAMP-binding protein
MIRNLAELVAHHPLLEGLPTDMPELIAGCARTVGFAPGRLILIEGERADTLYLLRRGHVSLEIRQPGVGPIVIETLGPGAVLGWSWLFPPYRSHLDARALDTVLAIAIDAECLRVKADKDPEFGYRLMLRMTAIILDRLQATRYRLLDLYGAVAG